MNETYYVLPTLFLTPADVRCGDILPATARDTDRDHGSGRVTVDDLVVIVDQATS